SKKRQNAVRRSLNRTSSRWRFGSSFTFHTGSSFALNVNPVEWWSTACTMAAGNALLTRSYFDSGFVSTSRAATTLHLYQVRLTILEFVPANLPGKLDIVTDEGFAQWDRHTVVKKNPHPPAPC
ncbi:MAG: hypothetical protein ABJF23_23195, partial [Bryobacteraceae bacterium]